MTVDFQSAYPPAEAVRRIAALCLPRGSASLSSRWLVGTPTVDAVRLGWYVKGTRATSTAFVGRFDERDGRVVLRGQFTRSAVDQVFNLIWLGAAAAALLACLVAGLVHGNDRALAGALIPGLLLVVAAWLARVRNAEEAAQIAWVCGVLREALSD